METMNSPGSPGNVTVPVARRYFLPPGPPERCDYYKGL